MQVSVYKTQDDESDTFSICFYPGNVDIHMKVTRIELFGIIGQMQAALDHYKNFGEL